MVEKIEYKVTDEGIIRCHFYERYVERKVIIPKETFIEAFNKYCKENNNDLQV